MMTHLQKAAPQLPLERCDGIRHLDPEGFSVVGTVASLHNESVCGSVFHYELEFIHPFIDGNGRMGRLWQSLILGQWNPIFEYLPVENMVYSNQQAYYDAISTGTSTGQCGAFIDFMLGEIASTLEQRQGEPENASDKLPNKLPNKTPQLSDIERQLFNVIKSHPTLSAEAMGSRLNLTGRQVRTQLARLREKGLIAREGSNKKGRWVIKQA